MTKLFRTIGRAFAPADAPAEDAVHFHRGAQGVHVCDNAGCVSPGLDAADR